MKKPRSLYETYKLFLLLFTIILPTVTGLSLLLSILVFCLATSVWWIGLLFIIFGLAALGIWLLLRRFILDAMKEEKAREEVPEEIPEEVPAEEPSEEVPTEE